MDTLEGCRVRMARLVALALVLLVQGVLELAVVVEWVVVVWA